MPCRSTAPRLPGLVLAVVAVVAVLAAACGEPTPEPVEEIADGTELVVFAPSSLQATLTELAPTVRRETGLAPRFHFAGSATLTRQIEAAANPDVVIVSGDADLAPLAGAGRLLADSRRRFLANRLVVLAHPESTLEISEPRQLEAADYRRLALGDPREVPVGVHAKSFLQAVVMPGGHTLWQAVGERIEPVADAAEVIEAVAGDPRTLGVVYASDATGAEGVRVLFEVPEELSPRIRYVAAGVTGGPAGEAAARAFLDVLGSAAAHRAFERRGFTVVD